MYNLIYKYRNMYAYSINKDPELQNHEYKYSNILNYPKDRCKRMKDGEGNEKTHATKIVASQTSELWYRNEKRAKKKQQNNSKNMDGTRHILSTPFLLRDQIEKSFTS